VEAIERGPGPALTSAAVRVLGRLRPPNAIPLLLRFLPFNEDEAVEEEALDCLCTLAQVEGHIHPALVAAMANEVPAQRSAAAYVLARIGEPDQHALVHGLLGDPDPKLRLRAAQGLAFAEDKAVIPVLVALLAEAPLGLSWQAEDSLRRLAGPGAPAFTLADGDAEARRKSRQAWTAWWRAHADDVDWQAIRDPHRLLGLTVIAEMDRNCVWECGPDGRPRWKIENLQGPMDAQVLATGRVLIAENLGQRVTERDFRGNILWEKRTDENPISCQRLVNGNTFIVSYQSMIEVNYEGKEVFRYTRGPGYWIFSAHKLKNGHIVFISGQGGLVELDGAGKELRTLQVNDRGGWCTVEGLPSGNFLVSISGRNKLLEFDPSGKVVWECDTVPGPYSAARLPSGNTLVASMSHYRVVEVDHAGKIVWEKSTDGRPFRVRRR
jgi:hypothetical protein